MAKKISTDLSKVLYGLRTTATTVASTLGAKGRNVGLSDPSGMAHEISNDGVFIANQITFEDREEDFGAYMVRNAYNLQPATCNLQPATACPQH